MSVLAREIEAYQRALDQYNRQAKQYNAQSQAYNETLVRDDQGRTLVLDSNGDGVYAILPDGDGKLDPVSLPGHEGLTPTEIEQRGIKGFSDYGSSEIEGDNRFRLLRQNPQDAVRETRDDIRGVYNEETGQMEYFVYGPDNGDAGQAREALPRDWRVDGPSNRSDGALDGPAMYRASRDASIYPKAPPKPELARPTAPDPTFAQAKRMGRPALAQAEAGLIGQVMRGRGAR